MTNKVHHRAKICTGGLVCRKKENCKNPRQGALEREDFRTLKGVRDKLCAHCRRRGEQVTKWNKARKMGRPLKTVIKPFSWSDFSGQSKWDSETANRYIASGFL